MKTTFFPLLCLIAFCGCTPPVFVHPLSDEKTSTLDERFLGAWESVPDEDADKPQQRFYVGRVKDKENTLEYLFVAMDDNRLVVHRGELFTTRVESERYFSAKSPSELKLPSAVEGYFIYRYEISDDGELLVFNMDGEKIAKAIESGELKGEAIRRPPPKDPNQKEIGPEYSKIHITASTKELLEFVKAHPKDIFQTEPGRLKRLWDPS